MTKLKWIKSGDTYYDLVDDFVASYFEGVNDYPEAQSAYNEIEKLQPEEISKQAGNKDFNIYMFRRDVVSKAYKALWKFYQANMVGVL